MNTLREINVVRKKTGGRALGVAVAYPSLYEVATKSLSFQMLYFYINSLEDFYAERFVVQRLYGSEPPALSIESRKPLRDFKLILFSVHYEPDYVNIVRLLQSGGVHPLAREREQMVVVGGPPVIANPVTISEIADVVVVGEIEKAVPAILDAVASQADDKRSVLDCLPPEKGFYVGSRGDERVVYNYVENLPLAFHPVRQVQPLNGKWRRTTLIEVSRGCLRGCRFCLEGHIFLPKRDRALSDILYIAERGGKHNLTKHATLIALSLFDHPQADEVIARLLEMGYELSLPSLRLDALNKERLEQISRCGQKTLTVAPETPSASLSSAIGKPFLKDKLLEVIKDAEAFGFSEVKLYFMVGLPGERYDDIKGVTDLVKKIAAISSFRGPRRLKLSLSVFVPKPQTPMQWFGMEEWGKLRAKISSIMDELKGVAEVKPYKPLWAYIQCVLGRAGNEATELLLRWASSGGGLGGWRRALRETGFDASKYVGPLNAESGKTWDVVEIPASKGLKKGYELCLQLLERRAETEGI